MLHGQDDIVLLLLEFEDQMHVIELIVYAKIDRGGGADEVHPIGTAAHPRVDIFKIKSGLLVLEKYAHTSADNTERSSARANGSKEFDEQSKRHQIG
jgi:hypothetical protein